LVDVELKGGGGSTLNAVFFEDKLTSEPLKATVDAYPFSIALTADTITVTGNSNTLRRITSEQIYDKVKSFLVDSYAGEAQTIVTRSGSTL
jgi:phosphoheptose isomerase